MDSQAILDNLLTLLDANGVKIRREALDGAGGGLCNLKGRQIFFVDTDSDTAETASVCAAAVADCVDLEKVYLKPQVRDFIFNATCGRAARSEKGKA
jgi:hypothetical protein